MAQKSLRFHATVKMVSDYQLVTKIPVAVSWLVGVDAPQGGVKSLDVRFTPPVRASPDTHSQGHVAL